MTMHPRSIFVSDVHLGCKHARTDDFLLFLRRHDPEYLYLVGDVFDGWRLRKGWYWHSAYTEIVERLLEMARRGTRIFYTPGNHDDFLRNFRQLPTLENIEIADEFIHVTADNRRLLVMHGDRFDKVTTNHLWLSHLGDVAYNGAIAFDRAVNVVWRRLGGARMHISKWLKEWVKGLANSFSKWEESLAGYAKGQGCHGIVCGHIHTPALVERLGGFSYYNTGDWVENSTAIVEHADGRLQLLDHSS
jgi:UDP-2,3-diacylglucosamine pyrophosphatase LpxH